MYFCAPHVFFSYQRSAWIPNQIPRNGWKWSLCLISTVWWPMRSTTHLVLPVSNIEGLWGMVPLFTQRKGVTDPYVRVDPPCVRRKGLTRDLPKNCNQPSVEATASRKGCDWSAHFKTWRRTVKRSRLRRSVCGGPCVAWTWDHEEPFSRHTLIKRLTLT